MQRDTGPSALVTAQVGAARTTMLRRALVPSGTKVGPRPVPVADSRAEQTVLPDYVKELITTEDVRRASLEARGAEGRPAAGPGS